MARLGSGHLICVWGEMADELSHAPCVALDGEGGHGERKGLTVVATVSGGEPSMERLHVDLGLTPCGKGLKE